MSRMIVLYHYYRTLCAVFQGKHESFFAFFAERGAPPSYIGLPQRFCEAKDLWEEREGGKGKSGYSGSYSLRRDVGFNNPSVSLPRQAFGQRNAFSRGRDRAALLPTQLLRICAGALKRRALGAVSKFAGCKKPTGLFARKRLLTPEEEAELRIQQPFRQARSSPATVSRGRDRAALLPTQLLRICAGALKRRALCAVSKLANGQRHTVALPRKHLLAPYTGEAKIGKRAARRQLFFVMSSFIFPRTGGR